LLLKKHRYNSGAFLFGCTIHDGNATMSANKQVPKVTRL